MSMSYEAHLRRIESILAELERDDLELDRALALFGEGVEHLRAAGTALSAADAEVRRLVEQSDGSFTLAPLGA